MASEFASVVNTIQTGDPNEDGTTPLSITFDSDGNKILTPASTTENFFVAKDGSSTITAANISVNDYFADDPYNIAAARIDTTAVPDYEKAIGNNSNATLLSQSRTKPISGLKNLTFESYLATQASSVGTQINNIGEKKTVQDSIVSSLETKLQSLTGVNLDEELTDMIKYKQAYEAAARVFSVCSDLIDVLLNMG